jgi:hypothetical protein
MSRFTAVEWIILICCALAASFMVWVFCMFTGQLALSRKLAKRSEADATEFRVVRMKPRVTQQKAGIWW